MATEEKAEVSREVLVKRLEGIGALVLNNCMKLCFHKGPDAANDIDSLSKAVAIWGRVRGGDGK